MFGEDVSLAMRLILALTVVLALIGLAVLLLKRFGVVKIGGMSLHSRQPRLAVMDVAHLDSRRKLVIVRRDTIEHLVMIGGPNDVVIEHGIVRGQAMAQKDDKIITHAGPSAADAIIAKAAKVKAAQAAALASRQASGGAKPQ